MCKKNNSFAVLVLCGLLAAGAAQAMTEEERNQVAEEMKDYRFQKVTTKEGFNFNIPPDMPIETRSGVTAPVPFEEYLYFKLKKLDERLTVIEKKIDDLRAIFSATQKVSESRKELSPQEKAGLLSST